jgi:glycosyltransferase involved in cell wall biosynthesis
MKKVLFFISDYKLGVTTLLTEQAIALHQLKNIDISFIGGEGEQENGLFDKLKANNIEPHIIKDFDTHKNPFRKLSLLKKYINTVDPDYLHVQNNWQFCLIYLNKITSFARYKIVYTIHGYRHNFRLRSYLARWIIMLLLLAFADAVIATSSNTKKKFPLVKYKTKIIFLGIDNCFFKVKNAPPFDKSKIKILFAGQFRHGKNQDLLINGLKTFITATDDQAFSLILPGDGHLCGYCKELAHNLGIGNRVEFPGHLSRIEMVALYSTSNISIIPTNSETFGQCISEPFAMGLCVITKRVGVAEDILKDASNGFFFNTEPELVEILMKLKNNPDIIQTMGNMAFKSRNIFSWDSIAEKYLSIYK